MKPTHLTYTICCLLLACTGITNTKDYSKGGIKDNTAKGRSASTLDGKKYLDLVSRLEVLENKITEEESHIKDLESQLYNTSAAVSSNSESISNIKDQITGIIETVNVDENYWNASATCGGSIIAQTGQINIPYRVTRLVADSTSINSVCVWIVRANYRSKIKLSGTSNSLGIFVTQFTINDDGTHSSKTTTIQIGSAKNYIFNGPLIIITGVLSSLGSVISFEGFGKQIHQDVDFQTHYLTGTTGHFSSLVSSSDDKPYTKRFQTISINIGRSILAELAIRYNQNCLNSSLLYHQNNDISLALGANGTSSVVTSRCCSTSECPDQKFYTLDNWFTLTHSTSILPVGNLSMVWTSKSNKTTSEQCGDVLMGKSGSIVYKRNINYLNNERCVWIIYPFPKSTVRISQVTSGMESTYDHLVVTEVVNSTITNYELAAPPLFRRGGDFKGQFIIVTFFTDSSIFRRGFELYWEAVGPSDSTRNLDGELISEVLLKDKVSLTLPLNRRSKWSTGFQLYMITGIETGGIEMYFTASTGTSSTNGNCDIANTRIMHSTNGHIYGNDLTTLKSACTDSTHNHNSVTVHSSDGLIYVLHQESAINTSLVLQALWTYIPVEEVENNEDSRCGGLVHGTSGKISYKLDDLYDNGERCIWVLHIPTAPRIELSLLKDGFESCCDYIMVNTINPYNGSLSHETTLITRANNTVTFDGPVLIITFRSDGSVNGRGFTLKFTTIRSGPIKEHEYRYRIVHRDEPTGNFQFPTEVMNSEETYLGDKQIFILAYSSPTEPGDYAYGVNFNATIDGVILHTNADCESDQLNFFINPTREGFALSEHYPTSNCMKAADGTCFHCTLSHHTINDTSLNAFGSTSRAFVAIYKPVEASTQQQFQVDWDTSAGCGGVLSGTYGRVSYKLGGRYKNSEQCIWTLFSENVKEFKFTLGRNGFESCCDYVILNSLNPENGTLEPSVVLKTSSPYATVRGPTVFITFKSDASVAGEGFSLQYFGNTRNTNASSTTPFSYVPATEPSTFNHSGVPRIFQIPANLSSDDLILSGDRISANDGTAVEEPENTTLPSYNYIHYHSRRRNSSFTYPRSQGFPSLGPNEILTFVYTPEPGRLETFDHLGSQVVISQMHLKLDESCLSDSVRVYERNVSEMIVVREFSVDQASPNMTICDQEAPAAWKCDNCPALLTRSQQLTFRTDRIGFIVIFKSVTQKQPEQSFAVDWTDSITIPNT